MNTYKPKKGSPINKEQAERYGPRIQELAEEGGGEVTAVAVLKAAKPKKSPLHDFFTWDDTEAAKQHRLSQARLMIRSVEIVYVDSRGEERQTRAFPSISIYGELTSLNRPKQKYLTASRVFLEEDTRAEILEGLKRRINSLRREMRQIEGMDKAYRILDDVERELLAAS